MSRGFVKEGDQEELPIIPPRAALPPGVTNYVTPTGYAELLQEKEALEKERKGLPSGNEAERRRSMMVIDAKLNLLNNRISTARVLDASDQFGEEVRFGAIVEFKKGNKKQEFQIVGVDEANIKHHKIAFTAPIAKILMGKKAGDIVEFVLGKNRQKLTILDISYPDDGSNRHPSP